MSFLTPSILFPAIGAPLKRLVLVFVSLTIAILLAACATNKPIALYDNNGTATHGSKEAVSHHIATLSTPIEIDLVYVDGKNQSFSPPYQPFVTFKLLAGKHTLGFRYQDLLPNEDGTEETVTSKTVIIRFTAKEGGHYIIDFSKPTSFTAALELEKKFEITLSEQDSNDGKSKQLIARSFPAPESPSSSWINTALLSTDTTDLFADEAMSEQKEKPMDNASTSEHLQYWWRQATANERADFKRWLEANP